MDHRIAVGGSRDVDPRAAAAIIKFLLRLGHPTVLLRRGRETEPGPLESELAELARITGCPIEWHMPAPGGRDEVFFRDIDMVTSADLLLAVFSPEKSMEGGTAHLIEKAIDQRVPAYAFTFDNGLHRVGEYDPDDTWAKFVDKV
jgi:hypothetical protein